MIRTIKLMLLKIWCILTLSIYVFVYLWHDVQTNGFRSCKSKSRQWWQISFVRLPRKEPRKIIIIDCWQRISYFIHFKNDTKGEHFIFIFNLNHFDFLLKCSRSRFVSVHCRLHSLVCYIFSFLSEK